MPPSVRPPLPPPTGGSKGAPPPPPKGGAKVAPPPPPKGGAKLAPPAKPQAGQVAPEPGYVPGTSDVTEIRPSVHLADADDDEDSSEFSVDDEELIDDQPS